MIEFMLFSSTSLIYQALTHIFIYILIGDFDEMYSRVYVKYSYLNYLESGYLNRTFLCIKETPLAEKHAYLAKENFRKFVRYSKQYFYTQNITYALMAKYYFKRTHSEFSKAVSLSGKAYEKSAELLYNLYKKLDNLGAEHPDFPGELRNIYLELSEILRKVENARKDKHYYLKISEQKDIGTKLVAADYFLREGTVSSLVKFYNTISGSDSLVQKVCELASRTDSKIESFRKQLEVKREQLEQEKELLIDELEGIVNCNMFSQDVVSFVINGSFVSSGEAASPSVLCKRAERILTTMYIPSGYLREDYMYYEYKALRSAEENLSRVRNMIEQIKEDISRTKKLCFSRAEELISHNKESPVVQKLLSFLEEAKYENNFSACYKVLLTLTNYFETNVSETLFSLKEKLSILSSVGYNVSYCEFLVSTAEDFLEYGHISDAVDVLSDAGICISEKYSSFLNELDSLEKMASEYYRIYRSMFPKGPIIYKNSSSLLERYLEAKRVINLLEPIIRKELTNVLLEHTYVDYILPETPVCNQFYNISIKITVSNPYGFPLENVFLRVRTFYGNISLFIPKIESTYIAYRKVFSRASVCYVREKIIYGNQYVSVKRIAVNVSSPFMTTCYPYRAYECILLSPGINVVLQNISSNVSFDRKVYGNRLYIELRNLGPDILVFEYLDPYTNISGANVNFTVTGNATRFVIFNFSSGSKVLIIANISGKRDYLESIIRFYFNRTNTSLEDRLKYISIDEINTHELELFAEDLENRYISQERYRREVTELYKAYNLTKSRVHEMKEMLGYDTTYAPVFFNAELMLEKFKKCVDEKNLSCARNALESIASLLTNISFSKKDYSLLVDFVCDYRECTSLRKKYERYLSGEFSSQEFERILNSEVEEIRQNFLQKVSEMNFDNLLHKLKLAVGENSTQYEEFRDRVNGLKSSIQRASADFLNSSPKELLLKAELLEKEMDEVIRIAKYRAKKLLLTAREIFERSINKEKLIPYLKEALNFYNIGKFSLSGLYSKKLMELAEENGNNLPWVEILIVALVVLVMLFILKRPKKEEKLIELTPGS